MRTTLSIPDEFAKQIKASLATKGYNTLNEYILALIRLDQQQIDAPKVYKGISLTGKVDEVSTKFINNKLDEPEQTEWPPTYLGKPLSGRKAECPICYKSVPTEFAQSHYTKSHEDI